MTYSELSLITSGISIGLLLALLVENVMEILKARKEKK